nr:ORF1 [Torque teno midi virus]
MSRFYKPTSYNGCTKTQMWMSMISDGHDLHCGCNQPFAHLLDTIFPEGHTDRTKPISYIIKRDLQLCLSGGDEEEDHGIQLGDSAATIKQEKQPEEDADENIDALLVAAAEDAENTR